MRIKLECNSCGYAELVSDRGVKYCPECGSSDIEYETDPLAESRQVKRLEPDPFPELVRSASSGVDSEKSKEVEPEAETKSEPEAEPEQVSKAPSRPVYTWTEPQSSRRRSGYGSGMSEGTQARIVIGLVGFILMMSGLGLLVSGLGGGFGSLGGMITLMVIGFILLAIATKGEICNCCAGC